MHTLKEVRSGLFIKLMFLAISCKYSPASYVYYNSCRYDYYVINRVFEGNLQAENPLTVWLAVLH